MHYIIKTAIVVEVTLMLLGAVKIKEFFSTEERRK